MKQINEEMNLQEEWFKEARSITMKALPDFLKKLTEEYSHDYGTICHSIVAGSIATATAMDRCPSGGITGFQAGCIMWGFIKEWNCKHNKTGLRLVDYDNFLYPQYSNSYDKTINESIWKAIQKEATNSIIKANEEYSRFIEASKEYKALMDSFIERTPLYHWKKEFYTHLGMGTKEEWDKYENKKKSGFEFAPREPHEPISRESAVYKHWERIVRGIVPFGYTVVDD